METSTDRTADTSRILAVLAGLVPDWALDDVRIVEFLSGGYSNENFRIDYQDEAFVLRIPERARPFVDRVHEAEFLTGNHRVPIPELVAVDTAQGYLLTRYESGPLLTDASPVGHHSGETLAAYVRNLHRVLPPSGRRYDPLALSGQYLSIGHPPAWIAALAGGLRWQPARIAPCHNDLNPWNVICRGEGDWLTLDWEWFGDNDPLFDLVTLHQGLGGDEESLLALVAAWSDAGENSEPGEPKEGTVTSERLEACLTAFWLREYAWAHAELAQGNRRPEIEAQLDMSEARLRAITRV